MSVAIGQASKKSGVKVPTIRYYEQIGLLKPADRTQSNRRLYDASDIQRLAFIRHARELGFELDAISALLDLQDNPAQSCASADAIAKARLAEVRHRIASLKALEAELQVMVNHCAHGKVESCRVIEVLANHGECQFHGEH